MPRMRVGLPQKAVSDGLGKSIGLMLASASASGDATAAAPRGAGAAAGGDPARTTSCSRFSVSRTDSRDGSIIFTGAET